MVKNSLASAGDIREADSIPGPGRSLGGHGNPLRYSCLGNAMDRRAWWATVHGVRKSQTHVKQLSTHPYFRAQLKRCPFFRWRLLFPLLMCFLPLSSVVHSIPSSLHLSWGFPRPLAIVLVEVPVV